MEFKFIKLLVISWIVYFGDGHHWSSIDESGDSYEVMTFHGHKPYIPCFSVNHDTHTDVCIYMYIYVHMQTIFAYLLMI